MTETTALNPLIDGDVIVYRVGFAVDASKHPDGSPKDEPLEYALATVRAVLHNIEDRFPDQQYRRLFLSGKGNFRDKLATFKVYKGNRDPSHRPRYYQDIKEYLISVHNSEVIDGQEADDAQGIAQWAAKDKSTVIVGIDKDLYMIPGWHYNWVKDDLKYINLPDANAFFFKQLLTGDTTDNIPGVPKIGPKTADKLIDPCERDIWKMQEVVKAEYKRHYGDEAERAYKEMANLLWIRREEGQECPY